MEVYGKTFTGLGPIARGKLVCEFNFHIPVSITVVRSIETPQNSTKPCKYSQYHIMRDSIFRTLTASSGGGGRGVPQAPPPPPPGPALKLCKNTYSDRAKGPSAFMKSLYLLMRTIQANLGADEIEAVHVQH